MSDEHPRPWRVDRGMALNANDEMVISAFHEPELINLIVAAVNAYRPTTEQAPGLVPVARTPDHRGIAFAYWASFEAGGDLRLAKLAIYHRQLALGIDDEMPAKETDDGRRKPPLPTPP